MGKFDTNDDYSCSVFFGTLFLSCDELHATVLTSFQTVDSAVFLGSLGNYLEMKLVAGDFVYTSKLLKQLLWYFLFWLQS